MGSDIFRMLSERVAQFRARHGDVAELSPGVLGSFALHGAIALCILFLFLRHAGQMPDKPVPFVPVDVVQFGEQTTAPPAPVHSAVPQQKAMRGPASAPKPEAYAPNTTKAPKDELEAKLKTLSHLSAPDSDLKIENEGASDQTTTSNGAAEGTATLYSVKDYIRAQILRRWIVDFGEIAGRSYTVPLRVSLTGRGVVILVEVADKSRFVHDKIYRDVALSARNAVLLSAPFRLPDGAPKEGIDFTLTLNPKDTLR